MAARSNQRRQTVKGHLPERGSGSTHHPYRAGFAPLMFMDAPMLGFAAYELVQVDTGVTLYKTFATFLEIQVANANLRKHGLTSRFYPAGSFHMPPLHS
jgi:hypothetical protein